MTTRLAPSPYRCAKCRQPATVRADHPRIDALVRWQMCESCDDFYQATLAAMSDADLDSAIVADIDELDREAFDASSSS